jgi:pimeloyl-ACP methyl ester carboxylesterase
VIAFRGRARPRRPGGPVEPVDAVPIVAVPGLGLSVAVARRTLDRLPGAGSVVLLPAFGLRAPRGTPTAPGQLGLRLLDRLPDGRSVLVGHSASNQIVVEAARSAPDRVAGLVLVGPTTDPRADTWRGLAGRWLRTAAHERPGQLPLLVRAYSRTGLLSMARGMDAARHHRIDHALRTVACPVLVVRGRHDAICPADWAGLLAEAAPDGRAETLPEGAHMVPVTHPDALASRIEAFVAERVVRS